MAKPDKSVAKFWPFASVLKSNERSARCENCFKSLNGRQIECQTCRRVFYCTDNCLVSHLPIHSFECHPEYDLRQMVVEKCCNPQLKKESDYVKFKDSDELVTHTMLLLRILYRLKSEPDSQTKTYSLGNEKTFTYDDIKVADSDRMHRVWTDTSAMEAEDNITANMVDDLTYNFGAWLSMVKQVIESQFVFSRLGSVSDDVLMRAFRIVIRYTLYVCDMTFINEIGKAFYIEMCFINHSCVPNTGPLFADTNCLDLRLLDGNVVNFDQLTYDFQIEMTAYSAPELADSLMIRNIACDCKKCSNVNDEEFADNWHQRVAEANFKYGNELDVNYCKGMSEPIEGAIESMDRIAGKRETEFSYHPFITGLLLWKFRNEWKSLINERQSDPEVIQQQMLETYRRLMDSIAVTHGSGHNWTQSLMKVGPYIQQTIHLSQTDRSVVDKVVEEIIPRFVINQKLA